jgi:hypothetical protein
MISLLINGVLGSTNFTAENVTSLRKALLQNYDPYLRPRIQQGDSVILNVSFGAKRLHDLNEKQQKVSLLGYFDIAWKDEFLIWDEDNNSNIREIVLKTNDIWWPTIALGNPFGDFKTLDNPYGIFRVSSSGVIKWSPGGLFSITCDMNVLKYPFDTQTCDFVFVVLGYSIPDIILNINPNILEVHGTTEWDIVNTKIFANMEGTAAMVIHVMLQRKPFFVILTVITPLSLLAFLNLFVFLVPVESGEKTSFGITTFLAYSIYLSTLGSSLPDDATQMPYMTMYIEVLMINSVITMAIVILQTRLFFYHGDRPVSFCHGNTVSNADIVKTKNDEHSHPTQSKGRTWAKTMALIDRILFALSLVILAGINLCFFSLMAK